MKFASLASGSKGNCTFVSSGSTRLLVDCGISVKTLRARLDEIGERLEDIDGIAVTHAHTDHSGGLAVLIKESIRRGRPLPVWLSEGTAERIDWQGIERPPLICFDAGKLFVIGDIEVSSFSVMHDCANPVGYVLRDNHVKCGIATDLGFIHDNLRLRFRGCDLIFMESNHDKNMLADGDYSLELKHRIGGRTGHLSNCAVAEFIRNDMSDSVATFIIAHLSSSNNTLSAAHSSALKAIEDRRKKIVLEVAFQDRGTGVIEI